MLPGGGATSFVGLYQPQVGGQLLTSPAVLRFGGVVHRRSGTGAGGYVAVRLATY